MIIHSCAMADLNSERMKYQGASEHWDHKFSLTPTLN
jgi:hypothetical protein